MKLLFPHEKPRGAPFNVLLRVLSLLFIAALFYHPAHAEERQVVKIGIIVPLTGPMASFGEDLTKAIPLLEEKFNSTQSKYTFQFLIEDGKFGQSNAAITAAKKLIDFDKVRFLMVGSSGEILQVAPYVESMKVLSVAGFAGHPDVRNAGDYVFRTYIDTGKGIGRVIEDMDKKAFARIAIISEETAFTLGIKKDLTSLLQDKLVFSEDYGFGDADFNSLVVKARSKRPQAYYLNTATPGNFITLFKRLREGGVNEPFYTYYSPGLKDVQESIGKSLDGTVYLDFPDSKNVSQDFADFYDTFIKQFGSVRAGFNFRTNYNAVKILFDGIMEVGPDSTKVKEYLYKYDRQSATGRLRFDSNGDPEDLNLELKTYRIMGKSAN